MPFPFLVYISLYLYYNKQTCLTNTFASPPLQFQGPAGKKTPKNWHLNRDMRWQVGWGGPSLWLVGSDLPWVGSWSALLVGFLG